MRLWLLIHELGASAADDKQHHKFRDTMELLPVKEIKINQVKIDHLVKSIYRPIRCSRHRLGDDLLDTYLVSTEGLQELLSLKNAHN